MSSTPCCEKVSHHNVSLSSFYHQHASVFQFPDFLFFLWVCCITAVLFYNQTSESWPLASWHERLKSGEIWAIWHLISPSLCSLSLKLSRQQSSVSRGFQINLEFNAQRSIEQSHTITQSIYIQRGDTNTEITPNKKEKPIPTRQSRTIWVYTS